MSAAIIEIEKDAPATPQAKEHIQPRAPRRPSRLDPFRHSPSDEDDRFFSTAATQKASDASAKPTVAQASSTPIPADKQAGTIDKALFPSILAAALQMDKYFDVKGYRAFLDRIFAEAGSPTDPVEVMLLEQLVLAHLRAAQLQAHAGMAEGLEAVRLYNAAAARLLAEFRKTALALKSYRESPARRDRTGPPPQ